MANFALNYSFSRNLPIPLDEDAVKATLAEVDEYVKTKGKCYEGQLFSVTGETGDNVVKNGLYIALSKGENGQVIKLASQDALDAVAASAGKIDKIQLNGTELTINDKGVNIDLSTYATIEYVDGQISELSGVYAPKAEFEEVKKKVEDITSTGGEPNVQSDWNTTDTESDSYIKNKPNLDVYATKDELSETKDDIDSAISDLADVYAPKDAFETLVGEDVDKSARDIAAEEVARVVANADKDFDTLKEIADWIKNDVTGAANMANDIAALKQEDTAIDGRLDVLEGVKHSHSNKEVIDGISETKVAAWDDANEKKHVHENKTVLDGISEAKVTAWDAAEQNAKDYADGQVAEAILSANTFAATAEQNAKAHAEGLAVNYDTAGAASNALTEAKSYTDTEFGKATAYTDTQVSDAKTSMKTYVDTEVSGAKTYAEGLKTEAINQAKSYADGLAVNYDKKGDADAALASAKLYADGLKTEAIEAAAEDATAKANAAKTAAIDAAATDATTKADAAQAAAEAYADSLAVNYDAAGAAASASNTALENAKIYTNEEIAKLSDVYDAKGAAGTALKDAKDYVDEKLVNYATQSFVTDKIVSALTNGTVDITGYAKEEDVATAITAAKVEVYASATTYADSVASDAEQNAKDYADGLAVKYDAAGAAAEALTDAKAHAEGLVKDAEGNSLFDAAGSADAAQAAAEAYADDLDDAMDIRVKKLEAIDHTQLASDAAASAVATILDGAPESFNTLKEVADWISNNDHADDVAALVTDVENLKKIDHDAYKGADETVLSDAKDYVDDEIAKLSFDEAGTAKNLADAAEQKAKDYADGLVKDDEGNSRFDAAGSAAAAQAAAEATAAADATAKANAAQTAAEATAAADATSKADAALASAKSYAEGLVENIKPYEGGVAASITMGEEDTYVVDVKVSDDEKNFLEVNESNELEVKGITLDAAKTSKDITVEGGAWESIVKPVFGDTVPAGTTWESFLEAMLCVEKFVGSVNTSRSFSVSCGNVNPGIKYGSTDANGKTLEVGTKVTLAKTTANATTASQSLTVSAFTYGYKIGADGERTTATAYTETLTPSKTKADDSLKITFTGFTTDVDGATVVPTKSGNTEIAAVTMYVMPGNNKITVAQTGDTYAASTAVTADTIYISTNLKNYYKSDKTTENTYTVSYPAASKTATDTTDYTVTGATKYFIGDIVAKNENGYWDTDRSEVVRGLATTGWTTANTISNVAHTFKVGTKQQAVVVPAKYTTVTGKDANQGDVAFNHVKTFDFTNAQGYVSSYKVFVAPADDGLGSDSKITITIK